MRRLTKPDEVLHRSEVSGHLDWHRPVALMQCATLHHVAPEQRPAEFMRAYREALPSGSYLVLSQFYDPQDNSGYYSQVAHSMQKRMWDSGFSSGYLRTLDEIRDFFGDWEMIEPGLAPVLDWWPDGPRLRPLSDVENIMICGVARKPSARLEPFQVGHGEESVLGSRGHGQ